MRTLKSLFNIVEAPFIFYFLNFDVCVVWWCLDGPINSQEYNVLTFMRSLSILSITPLNKRSGWPFYSNSRLWEEINKMNPVTFYFHCFEALNAAFEVQFFQGFNFTPISQTLIIACRDMQLRFLLKWKHCWTMPLRLELTRVWYFDPWTKTESKRDTHR